MKSVSLISLFLILAFMTSCASILDKLEAVGKPPKLAELKDPTTRPDYKPITIPLPETAQPKKIEANSLWQPGAKSFFRDGRAARVGDILRVKINITDQAEFDNTTTNT
ncbi:MAG: flagellar basal body L-ring protein FlgH, partial [Pseudomonadota bacterium]